MTVSQLINTTSAAVAFALPSASVAASNNGYRSTSGNAVNIRGATGSNTAPSYQHDLSNRSRVSLELSSVDPDIAGLDMSIEGGELYRHDW